VKKAFEFYAHGYRAEPKRTGLLSQLRHEPVYLFRKDAVEYYGITEQQVF